MRKGPANYHASQYSIAQTDKHSHSKYFGLTEYGDMSQSPKNLWDKLYNEGKSKSRQRTDTKAADDIEFEKDPNAYTFHPQIDRISYRPKQSPIKMRMRQRPKTTYKSPSKKKVKPLVYEAPVEEKPIEPDEES